MSVAMQEARAAVMPLFRGAALAVPVMITAQFFLVGVAVFSDGGAWDLHRLNGTLIALPALLAAVLAFTVEDLRGHRGATLRLLALYAMQFGWLALGEATGLGIVRALHALNAVMLMGVAVSLAERTARRG